MWENKHTKSIYRPHFFFTGADVMNSNTEFHQ